MKKLFLTALYSVSGFLVLSQAQAATIIVPTDHTTIEAAVAAAVAGDTVYILDGNYTPAQISVSNKAITVEGQSQAGVILNSTSTGRGFEVQGGNVTLRNFTWNGNAGCVGSGCYGIKLEGQVPIAGGKAGGYTLENITVNNSFRTGIDLNGVSSASLSNITVNSTANGNGISATDSTNVIFNNITTSGNAWGGVALYAFGNFYTPASATGMNFTGTFTSDETLKIYYQRAVANDTNYPVNITPPAAYTYRVMNDTRTGEEFGTYATDLATAVTLAQIIEAGQGNVNDSPVEIINSANPATPIEDEDPTTSGFQSAAPVFDSLSVVAQDSGGGAKAGASDGKFYVAEGEKIYFTLNLNPDDTFGSGSHVDFTIGGTANASGNFTSSSSITDTTSNRNRTFTVASGQNGLVTVTGVEMQDFVGLDITNLPGSFAATNIVVDTVAPALNNLSITSPTNNTNPTLTYDLVEATSPTVSVTLGGACSGTASAVTPGVGLSFAVGPLAEGTHACTLTATDLAGNVSTTQNFNVTVDTTDPTVTSVVALETGARNVGGTEYLNAGDQICYTFNFSESVQITVNTASTANNVTTRDNDFTTGTNLTSDQICFTVINGDNGTISPVVNLTLTDTAGNTTNVTTANPSGTYISDTTAPVINGVALTSSNAQSPNYAKTNDTITVDFTVTETNGVEFRGGTPTILGATATSNLAGGVVSQISRFTDGNEVTTGDNNDELYIDFSIRLRDYAGNNSNNVSASSEGLDTQMQYDETDPVVNNVRITSSDKTADTGFNAAYTGDQGLPDPTYYANTGDTIEVTFAVCDYSDSNLIPPTGTFMGQNVTLDPALHSTVTSTTCNTTTGTAHGQYRIWTYQYTPTGADPEGQVTFSFDITDNAGNNDTTPINITQAATAYRVIYDVTAPDTNGLDVNDLLGDETVQFKPRSQAIYSWTGDTDPTTNAADNQVSGIYSYLIDYIHSTDTTLSNEINTEVVLDTAGRNFTPAAYRFPASNFEYELFMNLRDKAGNISNAGVKPKFYSQKYTVAVEGTITDENGQPLSGAFVKVVARFGEECLIGIEICSGPIGTTGTSGQYSVMVRDDANYTVTMHHPDYHMVKYDIFFPLNATEDFVINPQFVPVDNVHLSQSGNEVIRIETTAQYTDTNGDAHPTFVDVTSQSGEISLNTQSDGSIQVTSLGRILSMTTNNQAVVISQIGANTYQIVNAGAVKSSGSLSGARTFKPGEMSFGTSNIYSSGASRIGLTYQAAGGKTNLRRSGMTRDEYQERNEEFMSYEASLAAAQKMNEGSKYRTEQYVNRNGHLVFKGYVAGRLPEERIAPNRAEQVVRKVVRYRRGPNQTSLSDRTQDVKRFLKTTDSNQVQSLNETRNLVDPNFDRVVMRKNDPRAKAGTGRADERVSALNSLKNKREQDARYVNKYRWQKPVTGVSASRIMTKDLSTIKMRVNGKSLAVGRVLQAETLAAQQGKFVAEKRSTYYSSADRGR